MAWHRMTFNDHDAQAMCARTGHHECTGPVVERVDDWPTDNGPARRYRAWSAAEGFALSRRVLGIYTTAADAKKAATAER